MPRSPQAITFIVNGQDAAAGPRRRGAANATATATTSTALPLGLGEGRLKHSVRLGAQRGGQGGDGKALQLKAIPGEDVVVLHLSQGPSLVLSPENARLLMLAQTGQARPGQARPGAATTRGGRKASTNPSPDADADAGAPRSVTVPMQLAWPGLEAAREVSPASRGAQRGRLGQVLLAGLDVVGGLAKQWLSNEAASFATAKVVQHFDQQVNAGVYALQAGQLPSLKGWPLVKAVPAAADGGPLLVLLHGTFSDTAGTFGKLWGEHPDKVRRLFSHYAGRVYALDHPTLGVSPIHNALMLAQALPPGARLHLLSHSRGGLVAEVLARVCGQQGRLSSDELNLFAGDAQASTRTALKQLAKLVAERGIRVERLLRVACPARGTLLASKRLDAYLSVLKWTMELGGLVITPALLNLLGEVARRRADPAELPGLAAMMPGSALVQWLHAVDEPLPAALGGELRVVAGDLQGDSISSWLKTLLADSYYWCDNDLVVHTASMYGGPARQAGASFVLAQGGAVSHFNYFHHEQSAAAIVDGLLQDKPPAGFRPIGALSALGQSATGTRGTQGTQGTQGTRGTPGTRDKANSQPASDKPAVFVLPGILGSHLKKNGKRIWLGWRIVGGLKQLSYSSQGDDGVEPDAPIGLSYDALMAHLGATHEVIGFAYDWRKPLEQEAQRLADAVDAALDARQASGQPVRLLAHSMGGLLARTLLLERPTTWARLMAHPDARLLMLGTPNGGSWAPMQVLSGDDSFGNTLVAFGAPFQDHSARMLMASFPGFIQLQTGLLDQGLDQHSTWQDLAAKDLAAVRQHNWWHADESQLNAYTWGTPPQAVLDQAKALRLRLDEQRDQELPRWANRLLLVTGQDRFTPAGYQLGDEGLVYLDAPEAGDGRVTLASARLPGVRSWQLGCAHGQLPDEEDAFAAYVELLQTGDTQALTALPDLLDEPTDNSPTRGGKGHTAAQAPAATLALLPSRPSRALRQAGGPADLAQAWLAGNVADDSTDAAPAGSTAGPALRVELLNSDLSFVADPLLLGHYRALALTGTEAVVDRLIGGAMHQALGAGLYPSAPGSHQVFINSRQAADNPWRAPRPEAVVVIGLGDEGELTAAALCDSVRQGVIAWGQRRAEQPTASAGTTQRLTLAATLIGSGGSGISVGQAAQQVALGVLQANQRLRQAGWPEVETLTLIELYLDRASEAWRALQGLADSQPGRLSVAEALRFGPGALRRPADYGYRGANNDLISALPAPGTGTGNSGNSGIQYTLSTRRARTELRAQATQLTLVRSLVQSAATHGNDDATLGRSLFSLLVPPELEGELGSAQSLVMELASGTAGIPWELLDTRADSSHSAAHDAAQPPWALRCRLLRKLRLANYREQVQDAHPGDAVLVIGAPQADPALYADLPGALAEAQAVVDALTESTTGAGKLPPEQVHCLLQPDARETVTQLLSRDWRIVHIAGHGEPPAGDGPDSDPRGVVLSGGAFLGPREINTMRVVPELVFVNCCHLAASGEARSQRELLRLQQPAAFAASVAEALMGIGVRCVIAAGWAVDDEPAKQFATTFYDRILRGARFIDAVADARLAAWADGRQGQTWAAYQCYGDPDWVLRRNGADAQQAPTPLSDEFAGIASPSGLTLALERITIALQYQGANATASSSNRQADKIQHLAARHGPRWGSMGAVAEAFGLAWAAAGQRSQAITWLQQACDANDASASIKAIEHLANLRVRQAWANVRQASTAAARSKATSQAATQAATQALPLITQALAPLAQLTALYPTAERHSLCASAHKRQALTLLALGSNPNQDPRWAHTLATMRQHYQQAYDLLSQAGDQGAGSTDLHKDDLHYAGLNLLALQWLQHGRLDAKLQSTLHQHLDIRTQTAPDFWSLAGQVELRLLEALADGTLPQKVGSLLTAFADLHLRMPAAGMWESTLDSAELVLGASQSFVQSRKTERASINRVLGVLARYATDTAD